MRKGFWIIVAEMIRKADVVLEVVDARMPEVTRIKEMEDYAAKLHKPLIIVVNKADIVSQKAFQSIKRMYHGLDYVMVSSKLPRGIARLIGEINKKVKKERIKVAAIGYPNTGKSSLINRLSRGGKARTSPESGLTRGVQLITGKKGLMLFDTPGIVPFSDRDEIRLGLVSGISPSKLDDPDIVAYELIKLFKNNNPSALEEAYSINPDIEPDEFLLELGKKMNMYMKGSLVDERRAAIKLLSDWHSGKIRI